LTPLPPLVSTPEADAEIEEAFDWYESRRPGLGLELLDELRRTYQRIREGPEVYRVLRKGIRRAILNRFPYGVYFVIEPDRLRVAAFLHLARHPKRWQGRR
jgi:plasmid stabilization system protein ParE